MQESLTVLTAGVDAALAQVEKIIPASSIARLGDLGKPMGFEDATPIPTQNEVDALSGNTMTLIRDAWARTLQTIDEGATALQTIWDRYELTNKAKTELANIAIDSTATAAQSELRTAAALGQQLRSYLERVALPARPEPADAAQEAALANVRADLRMLFDRFGPDAAGGELLNELERRAIAGDNLGVWLLGGNSGWPQLYLRSRGLDPHLSYDPLVGSKLAAYASESAQRARQILGVITAPRGLNGALIQMSYAAAEKFAVIVPSGVTNSWDQSFVAAL